MIDYLKGTYTVDDFDTSAYDFEAFEDEYAEMEAIYAALEDDEEFDVDVITLDEYDEVLPF